MSRDLATTYLPSMRVGPIGMSDVICVTLPENKTKLNSFTGCHESGAKGDERSECGDVSGREPALASQTLSADSLSFEVFSFIHKRLLCLPGKHRTNRKKSLKKCQLYPLLDCRSESDTDVMSLQHWV